MALYAVDITFQDWGFWYAKTHNLYSSFEQFLNPEAMEVIRVKDCGLGWAAWESCRMEPMDNVTEIEASISVGGISTWKKYDSLQELKDEITQLTGKRERRSRDAVPEVRDICLDYYDWLPEGTLVS